MSNQQELIEQIKKMEESRADGVFSFRNEGKAVVFILYNFERQLCMSVAMTEKDFNKHVTALAKNKIKANNKTAAKKAVKKKSQSKEKVK
jgi:hypothetical protein